MTNVGGGGGIGGGRGMERAVIGSDPRVLSIIRPRSQTRAPADRVICKINKSRMQPSGLLNQTKGEWLGVSGCHVSAGFKLSLCPGTIRRMMRLQGPRRLGRRGSPSSSETHFSDNSPIVAGPLRAPASRTGLSSLLAHLLILFFSFFL